MKRRLVLGTALLAVTLVGTTAALASWGTRALGTATAKTSTLARGAMASVTADATVSLKMNLVWTATGVTGSVPATNADGYHVRRYSASAGGVATNVCSSSATTTIVGTTCSDTAPSTSSVWYTVTPHYATWSGAESPRVQGTPAAYAGFALTAPTPQTAGTAFAVTVQAKTAGGANDTSYAGSKTLKVDGATAPDGTTVPTITTATVTFTAGLATASIKLYKAESASSFSLTDTSVATRTGTTTTTVNAATASRFAFTTAPAAGTVSSLAALGPITVQRRDAYANATTTGGAQTVNLTSSSSGDTFATTPGGAGVTSVAIASDASSTSFFYGDTVSGSPTITAAFPGLTSATQTASLNAGTAAALSFVDCSKNGGAVVVGACASLAVGNGGDMDGKLGIVDGFGNATTLSGDLSVSVSSSNSAKFPVTSSPVPIAAGATQSEATFHVDYTSSGTASTTLTAHVVAGATLTDDTMSVTK